MAVLYRCDVCREVHAEGTVPDSWRYIDLVEYDDDGQKEKYLACTACVTAFNGWVRERQAKKEHFFGETDAKEVVKKSRSR